MFGEFGNSYGVDHLSDGWQRHLSPAGRERNLIVAAIRNAYAYSLASSGLEHIRVEDDGGITVLQDSSVSRCLRYPNEYQTQMDFVSLIVSSLIYHGNAYSYAKRNGRFEITELHPLPPHKHRAVAAEDGNLFYDASAEWEYMTRQNIDALVPSRDVLHVKLATHRSLLWGETPIADSAYAIGLNNAISHGTLAFPSNMNRPSGVLSTDLTLTPTQMQDLRGAFDEQARGFRQGKVPILGGGMKWQPMGITASDSQVLETYNMTVLDLCRLFRVPPQLLGIDHIGNGSSTEALINQWRATGLLFYAEIIERSLERLFDLPRNEEIRFDLNNLARADFAAQIEALSKGVQNAIYSPNEARRKVGLPAVPFGESPRIQAQNVRLEDAKPAPSYASAPSAGKETSPSAREQDKLDKLDDNDDPALDDDTAKAVAIAMIEKAMK